MYPPDEASSTNETETLRSSPSSSSPSLQPMSTFPEGQLRYTSALPIGGVLESLVLPDTDASTTDTTTVTPPPPLLPPSPFTPSPSWRTKRWSIMDDFLLVLHACRDDFDEGFQEFYGLTSTEAEVFLRARRDRNIIKVLNRRAKMLAKQMLSRRKDKKEEKSEDEEGEKEEDSGERIPAVLEKFWKELVEWIARPGDDAKEAQREKERICCKFWQEYEKLQL